MHSRALPPAIAFAVTLSFCSAVTARAATINVTYALNGTVSGDPLNPPLVGNAIGSIVPLGSLTLNGLTFVNLATGESTGTFTMTFINGDTLAGELHEILDLSSPPIVPVTQTLTIRGGTGAFLWYHGTLTGSGTGNFANGTFSTSGAGTLETVPEPESVVLLGIGLASLLACRKRKFPVRHDSA